VSQTFQAIHSNNILICGQEMLSRLLYNPELLGRVKKVTKDKEAFQHCWRKAGGGLELD